MRKHRSPLEEWLWEKGLLKGRFAERIGVSLKQLRPALAGRPPSIETAHAIVEGTGWEVDYNALFAPDLRVKSKRRTS